MHKFLAAAGRKGGCGHGGTSKHRNLQGLKGFLRPWVDDVMLEVRVSDSRDKAEARTSGCGDAF